MLRRLNSMGVRHVVTGSLALSLHGAPVDLAEDLSFAMPPLPEERDAIVAGLAALEREGGHVHLIRPWWASPESPPKRYETDWGQVAPLARLPGVAGGFDGLYMRSELVNLTGVPVRIAALDDLEAMLRTEDRPSDREMLAALEGWRAAGNASGPK